LYNWYAVNDSRGLAPSGYHVPSDAEWSILSNYLGGESVAGGKMKETGTTHWNSPNTGATNSSGFTGLPGGFRKNSGTYFSIRIDEDWWSSTESNEPQALYRHLYYFDANLYRRIDDKVIGFSVRCVKN
jgi:uncharacterized protein (TIGR02145 family)